MSELEQRSQCRPVCHVDDNANRGGEDPRNEMQCIRSRAVKRCSRCGDRGYNHGRCDAVRGPYAQLVQNLHICPRKGLLQFHGAVPSPIEQIYHVDPDALKCVDRCPGRTARTDDGRRARPAREWKGSPSVPLVRRHVWSVQPTFAWVPSQKGLCPLCPQRHRATRVSRCSPSGV